MIKVAVLCVGFLDPTNLVLTKCTPSVRPLLAEQWAFGLMSDTWDNFNNHAEGKRARGRSRFK